jgi:DNA (cytosine-5)-methyltransferase 1
MKVVSLFSGAGGFDLGAQLAGHQVVWANDVLPDAVATYRRNIGDHIVQGDITEIPSSEIPRADLVIGGFPCQGFSIANWNRSASDPRNRLYRAFVRVVSDLQPRYFVAENVRGILSLEGGQVFSRILQDFRRAGYAVRHALLNAANFGVPQNRHRVFILGVREDLPNELQFPPAATHGTARSLRKPVSIGEALRGLPAPSASCELPNHICSQFKLKHNGYINHRPVDASKPAPTVTARGDTKGGAMINYHPSGTRRLTVRETAIIQGFPNTFVFEGSMTSAYLQVGNAVPPPLAARVLSCIPTAASRQGKPKRARQLVGP